MKLPRFHLSTLLLVCASCGASVGLWLHGGAWRQEFFLSYGATPVELMTTATPMTFGPDRKRFVAFHNFQLFAFDTATRERVSPRAQTFANEIEELRVQADGSAIRGKFSDDLARASSVTVPRDVVLSLDGDVLRYVEPTDPVPTFLETVRQINADGSVASRWWPNPNNHRHEDAICRNFSVRFRIHGPDPLIRPENYELAVPEPFESVRYSFDGQQLALAHRTGISIWRRVRPFGWSGFFALPIFWAACIPWLGLTALFIRWLFRLRRERKSATPSV